MKKIGLHNYEEYAIDYMLGHLAKDEAKAFADFLANHPNKADEVLLFEHIKLAPEKEEGPNFKHLRMSLTSKAITMDNFDEFCVASSEGDLGAEGEKSLEVFISKHPELKKEKKAFEHLKLPIEDIVYPHKKVLKKAERKRLFPPFMWGIASAVSAAVVILFFTVLSTPELPQQDRQELAMTSGFKELNITTKQPIVNPEIKDSVFNAPKDSHFQKPEELLAKHRVATEEVRSTVHEETKENFNKTVEKLQLLKQKRSSHLLQSQVSVAPLTLASSSYRPTIGQNEEEIDELKQKASNYLYTTVIAKGIEGINKMAETDLKYEVIENKNGQAVKVKFATRFGEINRTLAQR